MMEGLRRFLQAFNAKKAALSALSVLLTAGVLGFVFYEVSKYEVTVYAQEKEVTVSTHAETVGDVLDEQDIDVSEHDVVEPSLDTPVEENLSIDYIPARQVTLMVNGENQLHWTTEETVEGVLEEVNVEIGNRDELEPDPDAPVEDGLEIEFEEAFPVTVYGQNSERDVWVTETDVQSVLHHAGISLNKSDRVEPEREEVLTEESEIHITRVQTVTETETESIPYETVSTEDGSLQKGKERVEQKGKEGTLEKKYEVVLENGEEVSRELTEETTVENSRDHLVAVGTKEPEPEPEPSSETATAASSSGSAGSNESSSADNSTSNSGGSWKTMSATAYTANCTGCSGVTATGVNLKANPGARVIAVDPGVIPLGSRVEVKGYGTYTAADTGGAINGNKIDIFMPGKGEAQSFGRRSVQVRILD
ncbi:G5 and 3D domain-containing protein [Alkalicoccus urumqiensis]|uniref:G5 domain-containing protein n=1 Tax=Alkalicoccus urumqiensis TaxID=1548213 RepID=A0A2P6MDN3_ALKUR|nr:G5 and 3D domain-containing protein [Alkalicoccus urumqiensis]PRO64386.1 hypothetical protein C6I21_14920 [Alkalicoccus urumqiensis]